MAEIYAFKPREHPDLPGCHLDTIYDDEAHLVDENPYDVPDADEKIRRAIDALPKPRSEHELDDGKYWIRYDYQELVGE